MDRRERLDSLFLNDNSASFKPLVRLSPQAVVGASIGVSRGYATRAAPEPIVSPTFSNRSSVGSSSRQSNSDSISRRSSASSASSAPSIHIPPPWHRNPSAAMTSLNYQYDLPCEFVELFHCRVRFHPERFEEWIQHGASHFFNTVPPQNTACIFCDGRVFEDWRERMIHIGSHYQDNAVFNNSRPDYFVIEELYRGKLLSKDTFGYLMSYTERPPCDNLVEYGFKPPVVEEREQRQRAEPLRRQKEKYGKDLAREDRQMRRESGGKGKGRSERTHRSSGKSQIIYQEPRS